MTMVLGTVTDALMAKLGGDGEEMRNGFAQGSLGRAQTVAAAVAAPVRAYAAASAARTTRTWDPRIYYKRIGIDVNEP